MKLTFYPHCEVGALCQQPLMEGPLTRYIVMAGNAPFEGYENNTQVLGSVKRRSEESTIRPPPRFEDLATSPAEPDSDSNRELATDVRGGGLDIQF